MSDFTKFPKVEQFGRALRDDRILVPDGPYLLTEKLDGANAGIIKYSDTCLVLHSRNTELAYLSFDANVEDQIFNAFRGFVDYVSQRRTETMHWMQKAGIEHVFGEWLVPHTIKYPENMYQQFYIFSLDVIKHASPPYPLVPTLRRFHRVPTLNEVEYNLNSYVEQMDRPVEGIVLSSSGNNPYRPRFKLVREEFKEKADRKWQKKEHMKQAPAEERMVYAYPTRAYVKIRERIEDHEGQLDKSHTPKVLGMAWNDYLTEFFPKAVKREGFPTLDMKDMKKRFDYMIRGIFFHELDYGELPVWTKTDV